MWHWPWKRTFQGARRLGACWGIKRRGWLECFQCQAHLQFKIISSRKHKSNYSLSPKQLQSLVLHVLLIILFHFLSPPLGCLMDMDLDKWGQKTPVTAHSVLLCGSLAHKVSTTKASRCKDCPWEAGGGAGCASASPDSCLWGQHGEGSWLERQPWGRAGGVDLERRLHLDILEDHPVACYLEWVFALEHFKITEHLLTLFW